MKDFIPSILLGFAVTGLIIIGQLVPKNNAPVIVYLSSERPDLQVLEIAQKTDSVILGVGPIDGSFVVQSRKSLNAEVTEYETDTRFDYVSTLNEAGADWAINALFTASCGSEEKQPKSPFAVKTDRQMADYSEELS